VTTLEQKALEALQTVIDPELRENIVDLGLIYGIVAHSPKSVSVRMTLTTPYCPLAPEIKQDIEQALKNICGFEIVEIDLVWDPPYDPSTMASDEIKDKLGLW